MNIIRGYNAAFFLNGERLTADIHLDVEKKQVVIQGTSCVKTIQTQNTILVFTDEGRYSITYLCPYRFLEVPESTYHKLRLVSVKFFRNEP